MLNIVLLEPEIPYNTANIGRTCYLTKTRLHLIRPLGFILSDKNLRRIGLDYWKDVDLLVHDSYEDFLEYAQGHTIYMATTKAKKYYSQVEYKDGDFIMFGKESKGIDEDIIYSNFENAIKVQMRSDSDRSLNLSNTAAIVLYEGLRQLGFKDMD